MPEAVASEVTVMSRDADDDGVANLCAGDGHGSGHLVAATNLGREHRSPAAGRGIGNDVTAIAHRAQHGLVGVEDSVDVLIDIHCFVAGMAIGATGRSRSVRLHLKGHGMSLLEENR